MWFYRLMLAACSGLLAFRYFYSATLQKCRFVGLGGKSATETTEMVASGTGTNPNHSPTIYSDAVTTLSLWHVTDRQLSVVMVSQLLDDDCLLLMIVNDR